MHVINMAESSSSGWKANWIKRKLDKMIKINSQWSDLNAPVHRIYKKYTQKIHYALDFLHFVHWNRENEGKSVPRAVFMCLFCHPSFEWLYEWHKQNQLFERARERFDPCEQHTPKHAYTDTLEKKSNFNETFWNNNNNNNKKRFHPPRKKCLIEK